MVEDGPGGGRRPSGCRNPRFARSRLDSQMRTHVPTRQRRRTVPRKSIFLWHEVVHQRFNESLHFYLLGIQNYKLTTLSQIASDLQGFGIAGYCLYEIYGPYDVFMRVWLNRDTKVRLDQWLAETGYLRNYASFQVLQQRHWAERHLDHLYSGSWINKNFAIWIGGGEE